MDRNWQPYLKHFKDILNTIMDPKDPKPAKKHICHKCHTEFRLRSTLTRHLQRKNPCNVVHRCPICLLNFTKKSRLQRHLNRKTACKPKVPVPKIKPYTCNLCGEKFSHKSTKTRHDKNICRIRKLKPEDWLRHIEKLETKLKTITEERDKYYDLYRKIKKSL